MQQRWGHHLATPEGYIAELGEDTYHHWFGGQSWQIQDDSEVFGGPTLLLTLDLNDPKLDCLQVNACAQLPLCSYINCSIWDGKQVFQIVPDQHRVLLIHRDVDSPEPLPPEVMLPNPLPERHIRLRKMYKTEYPVDKKTYYDAFESFTGGASFIRILGPPLWLEPISESCGCGLPMEYIASIGYESLLHPEGYLPDEAFFIGEGALYFFLCHTCLQIVVTSQGT